MQPREEPNADELKYERIIAIGDLHGHLEPLTRLLKILDPGDDDLLIFIGDYVDRGPASRDVVEALIELGSSSRNIVFLKGNHEDMMLGCLGYPACVNDLETWLYNGGGLTLKSYGMGPEDFSRLGGFPPVENQVSVLSRYVPDEHLDFLSDLLVMFETESFFFCHAGVDPHSSILRGKHNDCDLLWMRDHIYAEKLVWEKTVVCGHTPMRDVLMKDRLICIDTGLFYYGTLSAVDVLSRKIYSVTR